MKGVLWVGLLVLLLGCFAGCAGTGGSTPTPTALPTTAASDGIPTVPPTADLTGPLPPVKGLEPLSPTPALLSLKSSGENLLLKFDQCYDLDDGRFLSDRNRLCDFQVAPAYTSRPGEIKLTPLYKAGFQLTSLFATEPLPIQCLDSAYIEPTGGVVDAQMGGYACFQTSPGFFGYVQLLGVETAGIRFSYRTFQPETPLPALPGATESAAFQGDVTIPDFTRLHSGDNFVKTWRLKNNGPNDWANGTRLVFVGGDALGQTDFETLLPAVVPPDGVTDLSVVLTAPEKPGQYAGYWLLQGPDGQRFGVGPEGSEPLYTIIDVTGAGAAVPVFPGATPVPDTLDVTRVGAAVSPAEYSGDCPVVLVVSGTIAFDGTGPLLYQVEVESDTPGFHFNLPGAGKTILSNPANHTLTVSFDLEMDGSVSGRARLVAWGTKNRLESEAVNFSVRCP